MLLMVSEVIVEALVVDYYTLSLCSSYFLFFKGIEPWLVNAVEVLHLLYHLVNACPVSSVE